jgi:hypothetical protein
MVKKNTTKSTKKSHISKKKKSTKTTTQKSRFHRLDEHLVAAVLVVAGIAILIMLAGVISSTGQASFSGQMDSQKAIQILNQNTVVLEGAGRTKGTFACSKLEKQVFTCYVDGNLVETNAIIQGNYVCSCIGIN